jgi:hypothetical protein
MAVFLYNFIAQTININVKVTYQYNGSTKQKKHNYYSMSNILFSFFHLDTLYFYRHLFILLRPIEKDKYL